MKYELNQRIWYMMDNRLHSAPVLARMYVENLHEDWAHTTEQKQIYTPFGHAGVFYSTCHGIIREVEAFGSKDEMMQKL